MLRELTSAYRLLIQRRVHALLPFTPPLAMRQMCDARLESCVGGSRAQQRGTERCHECCKSGSSAHSQERGERSELVGRLC